MIFVFGMVGAMGRAWDIDASGLLSGFGISTNAMLGGVGVLGVLQLEKISAQKITIK